MILSIQSHVVYGYVGNKAATYPLQSMGYDVCPINTVQFSNHTGYGKWKGEIFSPQHIRSIIEGLIDLKVTSRFKALISGYLGNDEIGEVILETAESLKLPYLCDPVMGDIGRGLFVNEKIVDFFKNKAIKKAKIITPNHYEAELLFGNNIDSLADAKNAANYFHSLGIKIVIITSFRAKELEPNKMHVYLSAEGQTKIGQTPLEVFDIAPNGTGDLFSSLFLGHFLNDNNIDSAFHQTLCKMYMVIQATQALKQRELKIVGHDFSQPIIDTSIKIFDY